KFSAATTVTPLVLALETPPQPARAAARTAATRIAGMDLISRSTSYHRYETESRNYSCLAGLAGKVLLSIGRSPATQAPSWSQHVHAVLARAGMKRGGARERIIDLLASEPCALSAVEIEDALRAQGKPTGRASIYRVLDLLVEHGLVERVAVG